MNFHQTRFINAHLVELWPFINGYEKGHWYWCLQQSVMPFEIPCKKQIVVNVVCTIIFTRVGSMPEKTSTRHSWMICSIVRPCIMVSNKSKYHEYKPDSCRSGSRREWRSVGQSVYGTAYCPWRGIPHGDNLHTCRRCSSCLPCKSNINHSIFV